MGSFDISLKRTSVLDFHRDLDTPTYVRTRAQSKARIRAAPILDY